MLDNFLTKLVSVLIQANGLPVFALGLATVSSLSVGTQR